MRRPSGKGLLATVAAASGLALARWRPFRAEVDGDSMSPALEAGQFVVAIRPRKLRRGDVVVVRLPGFPEMVKRVVGLPGERVEVHGGRVQVGNRLLHEPHVSGAGPDAFWHLGDGEFAVLGDNRARSTDSTSFGPLPMSAIAGVVVLRYWPRAGLVR